MRPKALSLFVPIALALLAAPAVAQAPGPVAASGDVTDITTTAATLNGTVTPNGQATSAGFDYGTSTAYGSSSGTQSVGAGSAAVPLKATISGLKPETTYHYRTVAANGAGTTAGIDKTFKTAALPKAPTVKTSGTSAVGTSSALVSAAVDANGQTTRVVVDFGTSRGYGITSGVVEIGPADSPVGVRIPITGMQSGKTYHYRVRAVNAAGTGVGGDFTVKTRSATAKKRAPGAATGAITDLLPGSVTVLGKVDANGSPTRVVVQYGFNSRYGQQTAAVDAGSGDAAQDVRIVVGGLTPEKTYHYRILAFSDGGTTRGRDRTFRTPRIPNFLAASVTPARVTYGQPVTIAGQLTGTGAAGAQAALLQTPFPFTSPVTALGGPTVSDPTGKIAFAVTPTVRTRFQIRALAAGQEVFSRFVGVQVQPRVSFRISRASRGRVRLSGRIVPAGTARISLRRIKGSRAIVVKRFHARQTTAGRPFSSFSVLIKRPGSRKGYKVRVKPDAKTLVSAESRTRAVGG